MKWTYKHSLNAVAAKRRLRIQRAKESTSRLVAEFKAYKPIKLPKLSPDFIINIRAKTGERVQITATRWGKQFITGDGIKSARQIGRGIELLLRLYAK